MSRIHEELFKTVDRVGEVKAQNPGLTPTDLARRFGKSKTWVLHRLQLSKLEPALRKLVIEDRLTKSAAVLLTFLRPEDQHEMKEFACENSFQALRSALARRKEERRGIASLD